MKPRIYKSFGVWICFTVEHGMRKSAASRCPCGAYKNWVLAYRSGASA